MHLPTPATLGAIWVAINSVVASNEVASNVPATGGVVQSSTETNRIAKNGQLVKQRLKNRIHLQGPDDFVGKLQKRGAITLNPKESLSAGNTSPQNIPESLAVPHVEPVSVPVEDAKEVAEGAKPRRWCQCTNGLITSPGKGIETVYDLYNYPVKHYAKNHAVGFRKELQVFKEEKEITKIVAGVEKKEKKTWIFKKFSEFHWLTYEEFGRRAHAIGAGLRKLGLQPESKLTLFAPTSHEWQLISYGCATQAIIITTAYDTLGEDGLIHSLKECEVSTVYTHENLLKVIESTAQKYTNLRTVIYSGTYDSPQAKALREKNPALNIIHIDDLIKLGEENPVDPVFPKPDDISCIMYTSGSTGTPKGVVLTHRNIVAAVGGAKKLTEVILGETDVYLGYLPLAHILEFVVEMVCLQYGMKIGYGTARTLTDTSVRECKGDLNELRPTIMAGVPMVWDTIRKGILAKVGKTSSFAQKMFFSSVDFRFYLMNNPQIPFSGLLSSAIDSVIFKKIKENTGGRLRFAVSGGAAISEETQKFLSACLCPLLQGYGMTESTALASLVMPDHFSLNTVGGPSPCVEIKLVDVPEMNYLTTNKPKPQGEIWIRGDTVCKGYFQRPDLTAETITSDGWLKTGDVGEWNEDGTLRIIDRVKNLVKLQHGEYIAMEKMESIYKASKYLVNMFVYADSSREYATAVISCAHNEILKLGEELALSPPNGGDPLNFLIHHPKVVSHVLEDLVSTGKKGGLTGSELVKGVYIVSDEWTPESGHLTAAQKLRRKEVVEMYKDGIEAMYKP